MSDIRFGILLSLKDSVSAGVKKVTTGMSDLKASAIDAVSKMNKLDSALSAVGGTMIAAKSIQLFKDLIEPAAQFELAISQIQTRLNEVGVTSDSVAKHIENLSMAFGSDVQTQAHGFFQALDDGAQSSADAVTILTNANKLSKAAVVDFGTSIKAIQDVMNAYGKSADQAAHISEVFLKTDIAGANLGLGEISSFMQRINPIASELGASFEEVSASVATMTGKGVNARMAFNSVGGVLQALQSHTKELSPFMKAIGQDSLESAIQTYGFTEVLDKLVNSAKGQSGKDALEKLGLSGKMFNNVMKTLGGNTEDFRRNLKLMTTDAGVLEEKYQQATNNSVEHWNRLKAALEATKIEIGNKLLAVLEPVINALMKMSLVIAEFVKNNPNVAAAIGVFAGALTALGVALGIVAVGAGFAAFVLSPLGIAAAGVAVVIGQIVLAIAAVVAGVFICKRVFEAFGRGTNPIVAQIKESWRQLSNWFADLWLVIKTVATPIINAIGEVFSSVGEGIKNVFTGVAEWISQKINDIIEYLKPFTETIGNFIDSVSSKLHIDISGGGDIGDYAQRMSDKMLNQPKNDLYSGGEQGWVSRAAHEIRANEAIYNKSLSTDPKYTLGEKSNFNFDNMPAPTVKVELTPAPIMIDGKVFGTLMLKQMESLASRGITP